MITAPIAAPCTTANAAPFATTTAVIAAPFYCELCPTPPYTQNRPDLAVEGAREGRAQYIVTRLRCFSHSIREGMELCVDEEGAPNPPVVSFPLPSNPPTATVRAR